MESNDEKRIIGQLGIDTKVLFDWIVEAKEGDIITYNDLSDVLGRDVRGRDARHCLYSAIRKALNERGIVFGCIADVGIVRLNDQQIADSGVNMVGHFHRMSRQTLKKLSAVQDYDALPDTSKVRFNTHASMFAFMAHVTRPKQQKRLAERVQEAQSSLPLQKTLEAFSQ